MAESEYPVTSPVVNTINAQPWPPIIQLSNKCLSVLFAKKTTTEKNDMPFSSDRKQRAQQG